MLDYLSKNGQVFMALYMYHYYTIFSSIIIWNKALLPNHYDICLKRYTLIRHALSITTITFFENGVQTVVIMVMHYALYIGIAYYHSKWAVC